MVHRSNFWTLWSARNGKPNTPTKARQTGRAFPIPKTEPRQFPVVELAVALGRSTQTCKRAFLELEDDGLILRVRWEIGAPNRIYVLVPKKRD